MKAFVTWMKANPVSVIAMLVCLASFAALAYIHMSGSSFRDTMARRNADITRVQGYTRKPIELPGDKPGDPPQRIQTVINQPALDKLKAYYETLSNEYRRIFEAAVAFNRRGKVPALEGVFTSDMGSSTPFEFQTAFRRQVNSMFGPFSDEATLPRLNAGPAVSETEIAAEMARVEANFLSRSVLDANITAVEQIASPSLRRALKAEKDEALRQLITNRAASIHLYSVVPSPAARGSIPAGLPFDVGSWAFSTNTSEIRQNMFEGQWAFWMQQDVLAAISEANARHSSVVDAPVKRLLSMRVVPGAIGIAGNTGLMTPATPDGAAGADRDFAGEAFTDEFGGQPGASGTGTPGAAPGAPAGTAVPANAVPKTDADTRLPDAFTVSPTGRTSNALYDMRQMTVVAEVDIQKLPEFIEALHRTNYITVLRLRMQNVDEYEAFKNGYFYGNADIWRVELVLESIWFRQWTVPMMPRDMRERLGVPMVAPTQDPNAPR